MSVSLKASEQESWVYKTKEIEVCGLCKVWPCRSRFNVLCLGCLDIVDAQIKSQIRVLGPIVAEES